jgi:hypothetical protein
VFRCPTPAKSASTAKSGLISDAPRDPNKFYYLITCGSVSTEFRQPGILKTNNTNKHRIIGQTHWIWIYAHCEISSPVWVVTFITHLCSQIYHVRLWPLQRNILKIHLISALLTWNSTETLLNFNFVDLFTFLVWIESHIQSNVKRNALIPFLFPLPVIHIQIVIVSGQM